MMGKGVVTSFTNFTPGNSGETVTFNFSEITGKPFRKGNPKKNIPLKKGHLQNWQIKKFLFVISFIWQPLSVSHFQGRTRWIQHDLGWPHFFLVGGLDLADGILGFVLFRRKCYANFAMTWLFATPVLPKKWNVEAGIWMLHPKNKTNFPVFQTKKTWKQSGEG